MSTNLRSTNPLFIRCSLFLLVNCQLITANCQSDILNYAHQIVDTLASPSMHGRGYVLKGDSISADYIKNEFNRFGLKPFGEEFYQKFYFPVNTFPEIIFLSLLLEKKEYSNKILQPGKDFLIGSDAPSYLSREYWLSICDKETLLSKKGFKKYKRRKFASNVLIIDERGIKEKKKIQSTKQWIINHAKTQAIVMFTDEKLIWEVSQKQNRIPIFKVNSRDSISLQKNDAVYFSDSSNFIPDYQSQNVLSFIRGTQYPDSFIVFTAHYDHLGMMGKDVYFPGANDNASGCAMLLNLAKYYSENPPKYSVAFMAFGAEEVGLLGSKYYVEHPLFPLKQIKFLVNFDIVGTGDEGIKVVNATEHKKEFDELVRINSEKNLLPSVQSRGKAAISDHHFFEEAGVKTFYVYTLGGIKAYHDIYDRAETLPLTKFEELYQLVIDFTNTLQD